MNVIVAIYMIWSIKRRKRYIVRQKDKSHVEEQTNRFKHLLEAGNK